MASDNACDESECNAAFQIDISHLETDGVQLTGHLLGVEQLGLGIDAHLESNENQLIADASNDAIIVGAGHQLAQVGQIGILCGILDGESNGIRTGLLILHDCQYSCNDQVFRGVQVCYVREPFPGQCTCVDGGIYTNRFDGDTVIADGFREKEEAVLYSEWKEAEEEAVTLRLIPYYKWGNRGENEMSVYIRI